MQGSLPRFLRETCFDDVNSVMRIVNVPYGLIDWLTDWLTDTEMK